MLQGRRGEGLELDLSYSYWNKEKTMDKRGSMDKELTQYTN